WLHPAVLRYALSDLHLYGAGLRFDLLLVSIFATLPGEPLHLLAGQSYVQLRISGISASISAQRNASGYLLEISPGTLPTFSAGGRIMRRTTLRITFGVLI